MIYYQTRISIKKEGKIIVIFTLLRHRVLCQLEVAFEGRFQTFKRVGEIECLLKEIEYLSMIRLCILFVLFFYRWMFLSQSSYLSHTFNL